MKKDPKKNKNKAFDEIMFNEAGSANDCTGLMPFGITEESQYKSYEDINDFSLPEIVKKDIE